MEARRWGAGAGWEHREGGRGGSRAARALRRSNPLLPRRSPLGREAGAAEPRRPGGERAHLYWSNLAYTAHSAGLLS